ncbi:TetR family transcriptional regulator [Ornithinibacillus sp. L9]|uniref:TetR family transcriptional regulator n=1 Tax=Ornithinibacillus caprae TaxID=2678566 RepID=A0A6N8FJ22_9BACI|nr:TetR family transcriptional regulator [Ornithinibacillus caprae]
MNQTFYNLDKDKQERIINAALLEFAENGYEKASTNRIVKCAGIGKGMLFYYFKNKKELYHYLVEFSLDTILSEFFDKIDMNETDFIERLRQIARIKFEFNKRYPNVLSFLANIFIKEESDISRDLKQRHEKVMQMGYSMLYENIDTTLFRSDVDPEKAFKLIRWSIEGYQNELINHFKQQNLVTTNMDPYWDEFYDYLEVLKTIYYTDRKE